MAHLLGLRKEYNVTSLSPKQLSSRELSAKHLVKFHDLDGKGNVYGIKVPAIARLSLYNCQDTSVALETRILSSLLEITNCKHITITFISVESIPNIIQLDPLIENLTVELPIFTDNSAFNLPTFIVSPSLSTPAGIGLRAIMVQLNGGPSDKKTITLVDHLGGINETLLADIDGARGAMMEQYKIFFNVKEHRWTMSAVEKRSGIPDFSPTAS